MIDLETRKVELRGDDGEILTVKVPKRIEGLENLKIGDTVVTEYLTYVLAEFRDPTPAERKEALVVVAKAGDSIEGFPKGKMVGAIVRAVVTVTGVHNLSSKVTIKGPRENSS